MIDSHIHADTRPHEDFEKMALSGIEAAITCSHDPLRMTTSDVIFDHWYRLLNNDVKRAADNGLKLYAAIGIHPRSISNDFERALEELPSWLEEDLVVAIGEIGLETASESERNVFKKQLQLADELKMRVIVHTPRTNKEEITKVTTSIIEENIDPGLAVIDHVDNSIINDVIELDAMLGLTVQPQKMTADEAIFILDEYGFDKFFLDSDISSSPSDPLSVPRTVHKMKLAGFHKKDIKKVSHRNVFKFLL